MKKFNLLLIITCVMTMSIYSCKKDDGTEPVDTVQDDTDTVQVDTDTTDGVTSPTEAEAFITNLSNDDSRTWGEGYFTLEGFGVEDCRFDDLMTLKSDLSYSYDNGEEMCGEDTLTKTGSWEADFEDQTITFDKGETDEYVATITSLTDSTLSLEGTWNNLTISGDYKIQEAK